jgi:hypothetical protein
MNFSWPLELHMILLFVRGCLHALHNRQTMEYNIWAKNAVTEVEKGLYLFKESSTLGQGKVPTQNLEKRGLPRPLLVGCEAFLWPHAVPAAVSLSFVSFRPSLACERRARAFTRPLGFQWALRARAGGVRLPGNGLTGSSRCRQRRDTSAPASLRREPVAWFLPFYCCS